MSKNQEENWRERKTEERKRREEREEKSLFSRFGGRQKRERVCVREEEEREEEEREEEEREREEVGDHRLGNGESEG